MAAKNVLILESFSDPSIANVNADSVKSELRARVQWPIDFYVEYLNGPRFEDEGYKNSVFSTMQHLYAGKKLDLVMVQSYPALSFIEQYRDALFPQVPIVFWWVDPTRFAERQVWPGVTGVTSAPNYYRSTIDLALNLHPDTNTVAIITDNSDVGRVVLQIYHAELARYEDKVREVDFVGVPSSQLMEKLLALPQQTVVFFQELPEASIQPEMGVFDLAAWVGQRLPTYSAWPEVYLNHGVIGGVNTSPSEQFSLAAQLAQRVLSGEEPEHIPVVRGMSRQIRVDSRQLRRWNIAESKLPPGTIVLYKEPTAWERDRKYFLLGMAVIILQGMLIFGLFWQRARKRKAEAILRESEGRFNLVANTAPVLIWMSGVDKLCTYFNKPWLDFTGRSFEEEFGNGWTEGVHPGDLQQCMEMYLGCFDQRKPFRMEYRLRRHDGAYRWIVDLGLPRFNADRSFAGYIGSVIDVTEQRLAQEALQKVSGQLIEAQEKERHRIARELHDDISQKLALLTIELQEAHGSLNGAHPETKEQLDAIRQHCAGIALDVQALSHELHSSKLEYLGLVPAVRGFCRELAKQHHVNIQFADANVPSYLASDVSLCLFRVAQEALHNGVKYSGVKQFEVHLRRTADEIQLSVSDGGVGFNLEEAKKDRGLGLVSMQERINVFHGRFLIESKPGEGTIIIACVPLNGGNSRLPTDSVSDQTVLFQGAA